MDKQKGAMDHELVHVTEYVIEPSMHIFYAFMYFLFLSHESTFFLIKHFSSLKRTQNLVFYHMNRS